MQHFVALDVDAPIARALLQGQIGVMGERQSGRALFFVPFGFEDADFWIVDCPDAFQRAIGRMRHIDDQFVAQRQQRLDGGGKRVAQAVAVADESKAADFHAAVLN